MKHQNDTSKRFCFVTVKNAEVRRQNQEFGIALEGAGDGRRSIQ
jgi:hypothetical protein